MVARDPLRPLLLNTMDIEGGAAIATRRIHLALRRHGVDSQLLVQRRLGSDPGILGPATWFARALAWPRRALDQLPVRAYRDRDRQLFSPAVVPEALSRRIHAMAPDLVHLFWVTGGFLRLESLATFGRPIVWTLHDMWPFTGGCHYDAGCERFVASCGACPRLGSAREADLSRHVWQRKFDAWRRLEMTIVSTSRWLADCAGRSSLFGDRRIEVIPNCLDLDVYRPDVRQEARKKLGLPADKRLVLLSAFGATSDARKGFQYLVPALGHLASTARADDIELVVLGSAPPAQSADIGIRATYVEHLGDEASQVRLYSAADVLVAPSVQENLSNTVLESLACGTPVVAFDIGGMPDMIGHQRNGYLARPFQADDLAEGIAWTLEDAARHEALSRAARASVEATFGYAPIAARYEALYREIASPVRAAGSLSAAGRA